MEKPEEQSKQNVSVQAKEEDNASLDKLETKFKSTLKFEDIYETNWTGVILTSFQDLPIPPLLLRGITARKLEKPSAVQQRAIMPCLLGRNVIMQAQSGTGKTATFSIAILSKIDLSVSQIQVLILTPTRELALQIQGEIKSLGAFLPGLSCVTCIGGTKVRQDILKLSRGPQIVIGTPGRLVHVLFRSNKIFEDSPDLISIDKLGILIVDEADEMLMKPQLGRRRRRGLKEQIYEIFNKIDANENTTQKILTSATMPPDVLQLTKSYMPNPITILVKNEQLTLDGVKQFYVTVEGMMGKFDTISDICGLLPEIAQVIIFCNTRDTVDWLSERMAEKGHKISSMHGQMNQVKRTKILNEFRLGTSRVLITTDVCGRGIDIKEVSLVINYDLPRSMHIVNYIHRAGRCGRYGRKGITISIISSFEEAVLKNIETFYDTSIDKMPTNVFDFF